METNAPLPQTTSIRSCSSMMQQILHIRKLSKIAKYEVFLIFTTRKRSLRRFCFHRCLSCHGGRVLHRGVGGVSRPLPSDTTGYGQRAGGTHSYWNIILVTYFCYLNKNIHIKIFKKTSTGQTAWHLFHLFFHLMYNLKQGS